MLLSTLHLYWNASTYHPAHPHRSCSQFCPFRSACTAKRVRIFWGGVSVVRTCQEKQGEASVEERKMRRHQPPPHPPSAARLLSSQQPNALGRVTNGSQSERRAMRFPPGGIFLGRTWGSLCLMGSANPISATNAFTELRAQSGPVPK